MRIYPNSENILLKNQTKNISVYIVYSESFLINKPDTMDTVLKSQEKLQDVMSKLWRQISDKSGVVEDKVSDKMKELHEVILEMEEDISDFFTEFWRQILVGIGVLFTLVVMGLLSYFIAKFSMEEKMDTRHLLDLSEAERWSYIETKEEGDLDGQMKILRGLKDDADDDKSSNDFKSLQE